jgi:hypothetical protein
MQALTVDLATGRQASFPAPWMPVLVLLIVRTLLQV